MILEELKKLAEREHLLADEGYGPQKIHSTIAIDRDGNFQGLQSQMTNVSRGKGKPKPQPKMLSMPSPEGRRTSGDLANFLYDKSDYVFGLGDADVEKLANRKRLFRALVHEALQATEDEGLLAVSRFLDRFDRNDIEIHFPPDEEAGAVYAFQDIDDPASRISDRPAVAAWWRSRRAVSGGEEGTCIVCSQTVPIVRVHPEIKNVPNGNPAGVALVSFNAPAFTSFGFSDDISYRNAPFCRGCADAYTRALNRLLSPAFPDPQNPGQFLPIGNYRLSNDTVAVFWSSDQKISAFFGPALNGDPDAVTAVYGAPWSGSQPPSDMPRFFSMILSGAQGRAVLRSSFAATMAEVVANLRRYFDDIDLVPMYANEPPVTPLSLIIRSLQAPGVRSTVASMLAQQVYEAAVRGTRYPPSLLDAALRRLRAGGDFSRPRIAIIKAVLNARFRSDTTKHWKEINMALDPDNKEPGYRLGRLFAVLERLQGDAINSPNATIVDRYFGAACATPAVVFPRLMKMAQHHASKSVRGAWFQRQIQDVVDGLDAANAFPSTLPIEQQGLFSIGYYHQRADLFTSKKTTASSAAETTAASDI
ncbi:MAG: CRISPR-associated protein Csd1 [Thermoanaerobaculia bacterium]|nr:CRISPR-associated protein Csd1 [Thermoanaerobaculia bacterium]